MSQEATGQSSDDPIIRDALLSAGQHEAATDLVDEIDLAVVAERGLQAVPESRRETVAFYIATHPIAARVVLETHRAILEANETQNDEQPDSLPIDSFRKPDRTQSSSWWMAAPSSIAALVAIGSSIGWLSSQPTLEQELGGFDLGPNVTETPVLPGIEETTALTEPLDMRPTNTDPGAGWRRVTLTAGVAAVVFSPLLYTAYSRRSRKKAGRPA